jgi:dynein regulatory complex protein 1
MTARVCGRQEWDAAVNARRERELRFISEAQQRLEEQEKQLEHLRVTDLDEYNIIKRKLEHGARAPPPPNPARWGSQPGLPCDAHPRRVGGGVAGADIHQLQQQLQNMKATYQLNTEKLEYNYQILRKRDEENAITIAQQKRRINKCDQRRNLPIPLPAWPSPALHPAPTLD